MPKTLGMSEQLGNYIREHSLREPDILRRLREETAAMPDAGLQITPEQGQFFGLLIELIGARRALEIGTFTGYSSLWVALALPPDGRMVCCDVNAGWTDVARRYWQQAGVAGKMTLRLGPAADTLAALLDEGQAGAFDYAFIDADKASYDLYYERCLQLIRPGGLIVFDNMLQSGRVADPDKQDGAVKAIRALNDKLHHDERISLSLVPLPDGISLARRRP